MLATSDNPIIVVGDGVGRADAWAEMADLAQLLGAPGCPTGRGGRRARFSRRRDRPGHRPGARRPRFLRARRARRPADAAVLDVRAAQQTPPPPPTAGAAALPQRYQLQPPFDVFHLGALRALYQHRGSAINVPVIF